MNTSCSMSPLSQHPFSVLSLFRGQKSPSILSHCVNPNRKLHHSTRDHLLVPKPITLHSQSWLNITTSIKDIRYNTTSFKGSSLSISAAHVSTGTAGDVGKMMDLKPGANFQPDIWGNHFLIYNDPCYEPLTANPTVKKEHAELKEEVRRMISKIQTTPVTCSSMMPLKDRLVFIDTLDRLGVSFHFEKEIGNILQRIHIFDDITGSNDLFIVSTAFRLFRCQGIYVSAVAGLFDKFIDQIVQQNEASVSIDDIDGLLALYETSFYGIPDEVILDQIQELTNVKLRTILQQLDQAKYPIQFQKIEHVLYRSIRMNCDRLVSRFYTSLYMQVEMSTFGESLLRFAIHDYNIRQAGFKKELATLTKWCEDKNLKKIVPLSRHRLVEFYFWATCVYAEPQFGKARIMLTKFMFVITLINDVYDTYGTMEEIELFTKAFAKLDPNASPKLQPHMKAMISAMKTLYDEVEEQNPGKPYIVYYLKREYERVVRAYETIARWIDSQTVPTYEEYFDVNIITGARTMFPCTYFAGMGEIVTEEVFSLTLDDPLPRFIEASGVICRCMDDISLGENELSSPHTAIPIFVKHYGVSEEKAREMVKKLIRDAFKEMNRSLLKTNDTMGLPRPVIKAMHGHTQANDIINRDRDNCNFPERLKPMISAVLVDPIVQ